MSTQYQLSTIKSWGEMGIFGPILAYTNQTYQLSLFIVHGSTIRPLIATYKTFNDVVRNQPTHTKVEFKYQLPSY